MGQGICLITRLIKMNTFSSNFVRTIGRQDAIQRKRHGYVTVDQDINSTVWLEFTWKKYM